MGCLWAARLNLGGTDVRLLLRDEQTLQQYRKRGHVQLQTIAGENLHCPLPAATTAGNGRIDRLLLATKAIDAESALADVEQRLDADSRIVLLHNGIEVQQQITRRLGGHRVFCLSTSHGAWLRDAFEVCHAGVGASWLGCLQNGQESMARQLVAELASAGLDLQYDPDIKLRLWQKLAINCAINGLTVLHECRNGELLATPQRRQQLQRLCREIESLYAGIPEAPVLTELDERVRSVLQATANNVSSSLQDARRGRPGEWPVLNGHLIRLATEYELPCPENRALAGMLESRPSSHFHGSRHSD